jgi:inosose dehydratase
MKSIWARREFLSGIAAITAGASVSAKLLNATPSSPASTGALYPPMDLSYFDSPIPPSPSEIHFGYASITWGGNDRQAIADVSSLGFPGIQIRSNAVDEFKSPQEVADLMAKNKLTFVALSSGGVNIDAPEAEQIAKHVAHAKFLKAAGGKYLQVTDDRPKNRVITAEDYKRLGQLLTALGKQTAELGIPLGYHNHMGSLGQAPEEVDQILAATDPRYAKLELDIAHYFQGGGDPVKAIHKYSDRLLFLHIKDVEKISGDPKKNYQFVELGRGQVDLPAVFKALHEVKFSGWAIVELDDVPDKSRTPKECAEISKKYLQDKLGIKI